MTCKDGVFQRAPEEGCRTAPPLIDLGHFYKQVFQTCLEFTMWIY